MSLNELIRLARLRADLEQTTRELQESKAEWEKANAGLIERKRALAEAVEELEAQVKEEAVQLFMETGDRDVLPGVSFRMTKEVRFDEKDALQWALEHQEARALKLDTRNFKKLVKDANPDLLKASGIDFVEVDIVPKAALASNLAAALAKAGVAEESEDHE